MSAREIDIYALADRVESGNATTLRPDEDAFIAICLRYFADSKRTKVARAAPVLKNV